jgi:NAD(P)-dependent dehydrogenase (short-subunit alcohol dehydrogenase family)
MSYVVDVPAACTVDAIEDVLWATFSRARAGLLEGSAVVLRVDDAAFAGDAPPASAAAAAGAVGLARALATEGVQHGWRINVLSVPATATRADVEAWLERLGDPHGASGTVTRLGTRHQQRMPL